MLDSLTVVVATVVLMIVVCCLERSVVVALYCFCLCCCGEALIYHESAKEVTEVGRWPSLLFAPNR